MKYEKIQYKKINLFLNSLTDKEKKYIIKKLKKDVTAQNFDPSDVEGLQIYKNNILL